MKHRLTDRTTFGVVTALAAAVLVLLFILNDWETALIAAATLAISFSPFIFSERLGVHVPTPFLVFSSLFAFASFFLGEVFDFYERVWWWDLLLHAASGIGMGLVGFLLVFIMFSGDRYTAPPFAICSMAFVFAVSIGTFWELFEFGVDQFFGTSMQKTGRDDTMSDLVMNTLGAAAGSLFAYAYLLGDRSGPISRLIHEFINKNDQLYPTKTPRSGPGK